MDYPTWMRQQHEQFDVKHGAQQSILIDGCLHWPDGARRLNDPRAHGEEPPKDPVQCARLKIRYWEVCLRRAQDTFDNLKRDLIRSAKAVTAPGTKYTPVMAPPLQESMVRLQAKKAKVLRCRRKLEEARQELTDALPPVLAEQEAARMELVTEAEVFLEAIGEVDV